MYHYIKYNTKKIYLLITETMYMCSINAHHINLYISN